MDPQREQPAPDEQPQDDAADAASGAERETSENGFWRRLLSGVRDAFGADDEDASAEPPPEPEKAAAETPPVEQPAGEQTYTLTAEQFRRAVQSQKDRELVSERRAFALERAEAGDIAPISALAERGDGWAKQQLADRGETWRLGEIAEAELKAQRARETDPVPIVADAFDRAVLWPILGALPEDEEKRIVGTGIVGADGRQKAVEDGIRVIQREARHAGVQEGVEKALSDPAVMARLMKSEGFRSALLKNPVANKQLRAFFRNELDEPDLNPPVGAGSGRRRENDFMNDLLRNGPGRWDDRDDDT